MVLRWKLNPKPTGLRAVGAYPRGSVLCDGDGMECASVSSLGRKGDQWYWVAFGTAVPYKNTCGEPLPSAGDAKAAAMAYVKENMK